MLHKALNRPTDAVQMQGSLGSSLTGRPEAVRAALDADRLDLAYAHLRAVEDAGERSALVSEVAASALRHSRARLLVALPWASEHEPLVEAYLEGEAEGAGGDASYPPKARDALEVFRSSRGKLEGEETDYGMLRALVRGGQGEAVGTADSEDSGDEGAGPSLLNLHLSSGGSDREQQAQCGEFVGILPNARTSLPASMFVVPKKRPLVPVPPRKEDPRRQKV